MRQHPRSGTLLVCVVVCMGIALSIMLTSIHGSLRERRQIARELQMEQNRWLVDAGLSRGMMRLSEDAGYSGENWDVTQAFQSDHTSTIEISVQKTGDDSDTVRLSVSGTIRGKHVNALPTRHTTSIVIDLSK